MTVGYVVVRSRDLDSGGHQVTVRTHDDMLITVRVPPGRATSTGIREAIESTIATRRPTPPRQ